MDDFREMLKDMITLGCALGIGFGIALSVVTIVSMIFCKIVGIPIRLI